MRLDQGFSNKSRISSSAEIRVILKSGERFRVGPVRFFRKRNLSSHPRIAIAVKGNVKPSPLRNRIKRQLRELFRKNKDIFGSHDYFFYVASSQSSLKDLNWREMGERILNKLR